jgi:hypothetical protein
MYFTTVTTGHVSPAPPIALPACRRLAPLRRSLAHPRILLVEHCYAPQVKRLLKQHQLPSSKAGRSRQNQYDSPSLFKYKGAALVSKSECQAVFCDGNNHHSFDYSGRRFYYQRL